MEPIYMSRAEYAQAKQSEPLKMSRAEYAVAKKNENKEFDFTDPQDYMKAMGITGDTKHQTGDNKLDRFANIVSNIGEGTINAVKGSTADTLDMAGAMIPGADGLWNTADNLREDIPKNSIGQLVGSTALGGLIGGLMGKTVGSGAKLLNREANKRTGTNALKYLTETKDRLNRAFKSEGKDNISALTDNGLKSQIGLLREKAPKVLGGAKIPIDNTKALDGSIVKSVLKDRGVGINDLRVPGVSFVERIVDSKIPGVSGLADVIGKYANKALGPLNQKSAIRVRQNFINDMNKLGYSNEEGLKLFENYVLKTPIGDKLPGIGTGTGTALGAIVGSQNEN